VEENIKNDFDMSTSMGMATTLEELPPAIVVVPVCFLRNSPARLLKKLSKKPRQKRDTLNLKNIDKTPINKE
jgi:hypothetical protein